MQFAEQDSPRPVWAQGEDIGNVVWVPPSDVHLNWDDDAAEAQLPLLGKSSWLFDRPGWLVLSSPHTIH